jgi:prepilin-type N-terminal cleavage/methylation domain-containing protein
MSTSKRTGEQGFTIIEVMVAVLVVAVALVGTLQAFISSDHGNLATQETQAVSTAAEQALEQLRAMSYTSIALSSIPIQTGSGNPVGDTSGDPEDPDYWVSGTNLLIPNNFSQETSGILSTVASAGEALIGGGSISPGPVTVSSDGFSVTIYRYVTWVVDSCLLGSLNLCPGIQDAKRITVAAVLTGTGTGTSAPKPFWLSTIIANPTA